MNADEIRQAMIDSGAVYQHAIDVLDRGEPFWTPETLKRDFDVVGFAAPYVVVIRKRDDAQGSLEFIHHPRLYFRFMEHK